MASDADKIELLYKKNLGEPYAYPTAPYYAEGYSKSRPRIFPTRQIFRLSIPDKSPVSSLIVDTSYILNGGVRKISSTNPHLIYYENILLKHVSPFRTYWYTEATDANPEKNILSNAIPANYDPGMSYKVYVYFDTTSIAIDDSTYPWIFDYDGGYITFLSKIPTNVSVRVSFWRYEGPMGLDGLTGTTATSVSVNGPTGAFQFNNNGSMAGATGAIYDISFGTVRLTPKEDVNGTRTYYTTGDVYYTRTTTNTNQLITASDFTPSSGAATWSDISGIKSGEMKSLYINPQDKNANAVLNIASNGSVRSVVYRFVFSNEGLLGGESSIRISNKGSYNILFKNSPTLGKSVSVINISNNAVLFQSKTMFYFEIQYASESSEHVIYAGTSFSGLHEILRISNSAYDGSTTFAMNHAGTAGKLSIQDFTVFNLEYQPLLYPALSTKGSILIDTTQSSNPYGLDVLGSVHTTGSIQSDGYMFTSSSIIGNDITASSGLYVNNSVKFFDISQSTASYVLTYNPTTGNVMYANIDTVRGPTGTTNSGSSSISAISMIDVSNVAISANFVPANTQTYSLGSSTNQFKDVWVSNNVRLNNTSTISSDSTGNILVNGIPLTQSTPPTAVSVQSPSLLLTKDADPYSGYIPFIRSSVDGKYVAYSIDTLYISSDYGQIFTAQEVDTGSGLAPFTPLIGLQMSNTGQVIYAINGSEYVFISLNYGQTWLTKTISTATSITEIIASQSGEVIYAYTDIGYYKSSNYGQSWSINSTLSNQSPATFLATDYTGETIIVYDAANTPNTILISTNGGDTFTPKVLSTNIDTILDASISSTGGYITIVGYNTTTANNFTYSSSNNGSTLSEIPHGTIPLSKIKVSATGKYQILASVNLLRFSEDYGSTWISASSSLFTASPYNSALDQNNISAMSGDMSFAYYITQISSGAANSDDLYRIYKITTPTFTGGSFSLVGGSSSGLTLNETANGSGSILLKGATGYHYSDLLAITSVGATGTVGINADVYMKKTRVGFSHIDSSGSTLLLNNTLDYTITGTTWLDKYYGEELTYGIGMSADGNTILASSYYCSGIKLSTNGGSTFTNFAPSGYYPEFAWYSASVSPNGKCMIITYEESPYKFQVSTDAGQTWSDKLTSGARWADAVFSYNGSIAIIRREGTSKLCVSTDTCATWVEKGINRNWTSVKITYDGSMMFATGDGQLYKSIDFGQTWISLSVVGDYVAISRDAFTIITATTGGIIRTSLDRGTSWTTYPHSYGWNNIVLSANGSLLVGTTASNLYTSIDYGKTWTMRKTVPSISSSYMHSVAVSETGDRIAIATYTGGLSVSRDTAIAPVVIPGKLTLTNSLDIQSGVRTGTHLSGAPMYITSDISGNSNGIEIRHSNGTQGIGFGYNSIYAAGSSTSQDIGLYAKGNDGVVNIGSNSNTIRMKIQGSTNSGRIENLTDTYLWKNLGNSTTDESPALYMGATNTNTGATNRPYIYKLYTKNTSDNQGIYFNIGVRSSTAAGEGTAVDRFTMRNSRVGINNNNPQSALHIASIGDSTVVGNGNTWSNAIAMSGSGRAWSIGPETTIDSTYSLGFFSYTDSAASSSRYIRGYVSGLGNTTIATNTAMNFTGQHRTVIRDMSISDISNCIGLIVVSDNNTYVNMGDGLKRGAGAITISESLPLVSLSRKPNDKRCFGVISLTEDSEKREWCAGSFVTPYEKEKGDTRAFINSVGEGAIWVLNSAGSLEAGDYITTSAVPGYGQRQDDDLLHNYTVAKITMDCDFNPSMQPKYEIRKDASGENVLDLNGNIIWDEVHDASDNIVYEQAYNIRYVDSNGIILTSAEYASKLATGESVYIAAFVGCTYHCG